MIFFGRFEISEAEEISSSGVNIGTFGIRERGGEEKGNSRSCELRSSNYVSMVLI
jgi:hypothetical protein